MTVCYQIIGAWNDRDWRHFDADTYYSLGYPCTLLRYQYFDDYFYIWVNLDERLDKSRLDRWLAEIWGATEVLGVPPGSPRS